MAYFSIEFRSDHFQFKRRKSYPVPRPEFGPTPWSLRGEVGPYPHRAAAASCMFYV